MAATADFSCVPLHHRYILIFIDCDRYVAVALSPHEAVIKQKLPKARARSPVPRQWILRVTSARRRIPMSDYR